MCWRLVIAIGLAVHASSPAAALCFYNKKDFYAGKARSYTTIPQEFRDSRWVVKAKLLSADNHSSDDGKSWTIYTVRVLTRYKGASKDTLRLFTYRDSGGFYLDKGMFPDLGGEYLLFLNPATSGLPRGVRNVAEINFNCGQSRPWLEVRPRDRVRLANLAAHRRRRWTGQVIGRLLAHGAMLRPRIRTKAPVRLP